MINLKQPFYAYFFGLVQADGHLSRSKQNLNKSKLSIELNIRDKKLLDNIQRMLELKSHISIRTRKTNFSNSSTTAIFTLCNMQFNREIQDLGLPCGKKADIIKPPNGKFSKIDYFRGLLDGDGSLGTTAQGFPFISFVTSSEFMAAAYLQFLQKLTGKCKKLKRNKRDNVYNIVVYKEDAVQLATVLYYPHCFAMSRKYKKARFIQRWKRPKDMHRALNRKCWSQEENQYIRQHTILQSSKKLQRTPQSISMQIWRLNK